MTEILGTEYDVVGSGPAGLSCALAAAERGLTAVVLEKGGRIGGASCWSYGALWVGGNDAAAVQIDQIGGIADLPALIAAPTLGVDGGGLKTDAEARVLDWHGAPIPGLHAAGDTALHDEFGAGYQAGLTSAAAITFGCIAAAPMGHGGAARKVDHAA